MRNTVHQKKNRIWAPLFLVGAFFLFLPKGAQAAAWWGEGFRDQDWVLEHGGSIIKYRVRGEENSGKYKARLYLGNKLVETEHNGRGVFDDAINNLYKVNLYKGDKKLGDAEVWAKPGQEITVKFDDDGGDVEVSAVQVVPLRDIKLNSSSEKYVRASDLQPTPKAVVRETEEVSDQEEAKDEQRSEEEQKEEKSESVNETVAQTQPAPVVPETPAPPIEQPAAKETFWKKIRGFFRGLF